ncbi:hypothetical protein F5B21DRAFT_528758 [Xylaria acuta]|nr:hypothetical protein F5B21DRAFT_528758 [Xylaria acuta]
MARASLLPVRHEDVQREPCPLHFGLYHCGDFDACCAVDPCGFLDFVDPCDAAIAATAALDGQDNDNNGGDGGSQDGSDSNGDNNGGGDGGGEEITTTARHTSTLASPPSSTKGTETTPTGDDQETSSAPETRHTSSSTSLPFTSPAEVPTTIVNSTTFATGISSTSPNGGSATETTLPAAPAPTSGESNNGNNGGAPPLSNTAIAGVSVGGVVGGIALLLLLFWLLRRRRLSKRMSSLRGDSPTGPPAGKSIMDRRHSLTGTALGTRDVFGGPASNPNPPSNSTYTYTDQPIPIPIPIPNGTRRDEGWPLCTASDLSAHQQQFSTPSSQPGPQPAYAELDTTEAGLGHAGPGAVPLGTRSPNRRPSPRIHPSQLTPGFPGTQMEIQNRSGSRSTDIGIRQGHRGYDAPSVVYASGEAPPRATLNATDDERMNNLYANSWACGL